MVLHATLTLSLDSVSVQRQKNARHERGIGKSIQTKALRTSVTINDNEPATDIQAKEGYLALSSIVRATAHFVVSDNVANRGCCAILPPHGEVAEWLKALPC